MKKRHPDHRISEEELIARYAYVLGNVPTSVADRAYAAAFARFSAGERQEIIGQLRSELPAEAEEPASDDPEAFARFMRNLHSRSAIVRIPAAGAVASAFITSPPVISYFTAGAGSVTMDHQPPWVHELAGHETAPIDGGTINHRKGVNTGEWFDS
jgi:hypothetical protein